MGELGGVRAVAESFTLAAISREGLCNRTQVANNWDTASESETAFVADGCQDLDAQRAARNLLRLLDEHADAQSNAVDRTTKLQPMVSALELHS